jgi:drug/metabolite transporter (DMT)-like permease
MTRGDLARLVALAAIWGASFLFMRVAAPSLGPAATADLRMLIAGATLAAYFAYTGFDPQWRRWAGQYFLVGALNSAAPFLLYSYAALELSAGSMAVINATSPMFSALLSTLCLGERLSARRSLGLALGIAECWRFRNRRALRAGSASTMPVCISPSTPRSSSCTPIRC